MILLTIQIVNSFEMFGYKNVAWRQLYHFFDI